MKEIIRNLVKLQALEFGEISTSTLESQVAELRTQIPQTILGHYDRLAVRGKKALAVVRNQVCSGCHMRLPIGTINTMLQGHELQLCDSCGRYLYLPAPAQSQSEDVVVAVAVKSAAKPRRGKALDNVL
jgi:predicted  nucleic acid-binding Zn-ribbon protein